MEVVPSNSICNHYGNDEQTSTKNRFNCDLLVLIIDVCWNVLNKVHKINKTY